MLIRFVLDLVLSGTPLQNDLQEYWSMVRSIDQRLVLCGLLTYEHPYIGRLCVPRASRYLLRL